MRRSIAALAVSLVLATACGFALPRASHAAVVPISGPGPAALLVGIGWNDPASSVGAGIWAALQLIRVMDWLDDAFEHLKSDVRRAIGHPQHMPQIQPGEPPISPELRPLPKGSGAKRRNAPAPIPDSLPARSIS